MKKYMGNYTTEAAKALKGSERIICRVSDDGAIYVTNGYVAYKMNPPEYAAVVQPVTCCEAANWTIDRNGKHDDKAGFDLAQAFSDAVKAAENADPLARCPLNLDTGKYGTAATYYNAAQGFTAFYNTKYTAAFAPGFTLRSPGNVSAAVAYMDDEPFAMVLPIKPEPNAARAVAAYFTEADKLRDDLAASKNDLSQAQDEIAALRAQIEQQTAELYELRSAQQAAADNPQAAATEPKTAAELIAARFSELAGVTATIKGAQTAAPVVWLTGDTDKHADEIKAAGAKWSTKKSAFYVRVA